MDKLLWNTEEEEELFIIYSIHTNEVFADPQYDILCTKDVLWSWPSSNRRNQRLDKQIYLNDVTFWWKGKKEEVCIEQQQ